MKGDTISNN